MYIMYFCLLPYLMHGSLLNGFVIYINRYVNIWLLGLSNRCFLCVIYQANFLLCKLIYYYRILRTIDRCFFPSTRWLRPIVHIDLYNARMKFKKSGIPKKNLDKNDDFVYSIPLFCCRFFFSE